MDADKPFQSKRRAVTFVSLLMLALVVSGAQIKEANTFIFKIEFSNHEGLTYLLAMSVIACTIRYYSYSEKYRNSLFEIWSSRLLADYSIYHILREENDVGGLMGKRLYVYGGEYSLISPTYKVSFPFRREIGLNHHYLTEHGEEDYDTIFFSFNEYVNAWTHLDLIKLLVVEFRYRIEAWYKYRETLDLAGPYLLAAASLSAFFISLLYK